MLYSKSTAYTYLLIFYLFVDEDEGQTIRAKIGRKHAEQSDRSNEFL